MAQLIWFDFLKKKFYVGIRIVFSSKNHFGIKILIVLPVKSRYRSDFSAFLGADVMSMLESILDYKFLMDMGLENDEYKYFSELKLKVRNNFRLNGINIITSDKLGNKYYNGVKNISRREALSIINKKNGFRLNVDNHLD